ncbi:MAG: shikimate kinase, partial [Phycisphaerae bacterium]|nr:shikimate kinase [Phycisphaerae bacterium]
MNIILTGYRATGKTTVGEILSEKLAWPLVDTDTLIQERAGMSIQEIVAKEDWPGFRKRERETIADVADGDKQVVSAGGGAIIDPENARILKETGKVILLT